MVKYKYVVELAFEDDKEFLEANYTKEICAGELKMAIEETLCPDNVEITEVP